MHTDTERNLPKFSPSSISVYNDCPTKWEFAYIDGLKAKGAQPKYFDIGLYTHELMHHTYRAVGTGMVPGSENMLAWMHSKLKSDLKNLTSENAQIMSTVFKMVNDYVLRQMKEIDRDIAQIIGVEQTLSLQVTTPLGFEVILEGIADLVYATPTGQVRLRDHKTGARNSFSDQNLQINPQLLFYIVLLWKLGYNVERMEISWINSNDYKDRSKYTFDKLFGFYKYSPTLIVLNNFWDYLMKRIDTILTETPQPSYGQQCNGCPFNPICRLNLNGQPTVNFISGQYDRAERTYTVPVLWRQNSQKEVSSQHPNGSSLHQESIDFHF